MAAAAAAAAEARARLALVVSEPDAELDAEPIAGELQALQTAAENLTEEPIAGELQSGQTATEQAKSPNEKLTEEQIAVEPPALQPATGQTAEVSLVEMLDDPAKYLRILAGVVPADSETAAVLDFARSLFSAQLAGKHCLKQILIKTQALLSQTTAGQPASSNAKEQIAGEHQALQTVTEEVAKSFMKKLTKEEIAGEFQAFQTATEEAPQSSNEKLTEEQIAGGKDKKEKPYADKGWTPERRAEHAAAIEARQRQIAGELQALQTATDEGGTSSNEKLTKEQIAGGKHNNAGKGWTPARRAEYAAAIEVRQRQIAGEHQALQTATGEVAKSSMKKVTKEIAGELQALQTAAEEALQTTTEQAARPPNETLTKEPTAGGPHAALPSSKRPWFV